MLEVNNYFKTAKKNEGVFRNALRDLRDNRAERPMGDCVPKDLETEAPLHEIVEKHSKGDRTGKFTIADFTVTEKTKAMLCFYGPSEPPRGAQLQYLANSDNSVKYQGPFFVESNSRFLS